MIAPKNIFVWFLCAIAFLKVLQRIDSFLPSLGINVSHTEGSMLSEAMMAIRGTGMAKSFAAGGGSSGGGGNAGSTLLSGGLAGIVSRQVAGNAIRNANGTQSSGLGVMIFQSSLKQGSGLANAMIRRIANGNIASTGTISREGATDSLMSYIGYTALGPDATDVPFFSGVDIGGHIFATETNSEHPISLRMVL